MSFSEKKHLTRHISFSCTKLCDICFAPIASGGKAKHYAQFHRGNYNCTKCNKKFKDKSNRRRHETICNRPS
jgi:hypothetical protein